MEACRQLGTHLGANRVSYAEVEPGEAFIVIHRDYTDGVEGMVGRFRLDDFGPSFIGEYGAGRTLAVADACAAAHLSDAERAALAAVHVRGFIGVPLIKGDRLVALLGVYLTTPRAWTADEIALVEETAERTWAAVERARAEAALRESEARLRRILDSDTVGVVFLNHAGTVLDANTAFWQMTGYTLADAADGALSWRSMTPSEWLAASEAQMETLADTGRIGPYEKEYQRKDGSRVWLLFAGRDLGDGTMVEFVIDISERKRLEAERERLLVAEAVAAERQALLKRIVRAQEEERAKVAHEVHDSVTQLAHAAAIHLDTAAELLDGTPASVRAAVERGRDLTRQAANEARRLIAGLRPEMLDVSGLAGAIQQEVDALRRAGWRVDLDDGDLAGVRLDPEAEITLYRVAQEALSNVRKHAGRARVRVRLKRQNGGVRLEVRDWGTGFDPKSVHPTAEGGHVGLTSMRERMDLLGGNLEIRSGAEHGTTIRASLPMSRRDRP
jgi:PAS domain S-box-containing protein